MPNHGFGGGKIFDLRVEPAGGVGTGLRIVVEPQDERANFFVARCARDASQKYFALFFARDDLQRAFDDLINAPQTSETFIPAREQARFGADEFDAARLEQRDVVLRRRVLPHLSIHRRRDEQRRQCCECDLANRIAREADCEFRDNICGRRRDEEEIRAICEVDVSRIPVSRAFEYVDDDWISRERLEGEGSDELLRTMGHHDVNFRAGLHQFAHEIGRLVRGDRAGNAYDDHRCAHSPTSIIRWLRIRSARMIDRKFS